MEALIKWNDKFNTGNFVIDYQNQRLVRLINDLDEVRRHEELKPSLLKLILDEVSNYTRYHFATEEEIMETVNYSEKDKHKGQHREFIHSLNAFANDYNSGKKDIDKTFCEFLKNWLTNHITAEDKKIIAEISEGHGVA